MRQLVESLIYEEVVAVQEQPGVSERRVYHIQGTTEEGEPVVYSAEGIRQRAFGRLRLQSPVIRKTETEEQATVDFARFLSEITDSLQEKPEQILSMVRELNQTWWKDGLVQQGVSAPESPDLPFSTLEGLMVHAHPYHPCYKSRIGFNGEDQQTYGPEFLPEGSLLWVALRKDWAMGPGSPPLNHPEWEEGEVELLRKKIRERGMDPEDYWLVPVHPWQWREQVEPLFFMLMNKHVIIPLGRTRDQYRPQQSIRTMSNTTRTGRADIKLPLSITNTSAKRILGAHHVENAVPVSDWLHGLAQTDDYLSKKGTLFLREWAAVLLDESRLPRTMRQLSYGVLGAIWRESVLQKLKQDEGVVPFTLLCHLDRQGRPLTDPWVKQWGLKPWVRGVLEKTILPQVHLLVKHGVALESHAQNLLLIHRKGFPNRVAFRDLPGGIRIYREKGDTRDLPDLQPIVASHVNAALSIVTDSRAHVRDFLMDGFFHINLSEWSYFLTLHYQLPEEEFWLMAADIIKGYREEMTLYREKWEQWDFFVREVEVGQLTARRLFGEGEEREHQVPNPLSVYKGSRISYN